MTAVDDPTNPIEKSMLKFFIKEQSPVWYLKFELKTS